MNFTTNLIRVLSTELYSFWATDLEHKLSTLYYSTGLLLDGREE